MVERKAKVGSSTTVAPITASALQSGLTFIITKKTFRNRAAATAPVNFNFSVAVI
jgi:hypothetical protein